MELSFLSNLVLLDGASGAVVSIPRDTSEIACSGRGSPTAVKGTTVPPVPSVKPPQGATRDEEGFWVEKILVNDELSHSVAAWGLSQAKRNKLTHSLNGNGSLRAAKRAREQFEAKHRKGTANPRGSGSAPGLGRLIPSSRVRATRPLGVTQRARVMLSHTVLFTLSASTTAGYQEGTILLNDPTLSQGYSKYSAFYSKALVVSARASVRYSAVGVSQPWVVGSTITTNSTSLGSVNRAIDDGFGRYRVHSLNPDSGSFTLGVDVRKFANVPSLLSNYEWFSLAGLTPQQVVVLHAWTSLLNGTSTQTISFVADIEQVVEFTDPIPFT